MNHFYVHTLRSFPSQKDFSSCPVFLSTFCFARAEMLWSHSLQKKEFLMFVVWINNQIMARYSEGDCFFCSFFNASGHEKHGKVAKEFFAKTRSVLSAKASRGRYLRWRSEKTLSRPRKNRPNAKEMRDNRSLDILTRTMNGDIIN